LSVPAEPARCPLPEKPTSTTAKTTVAFEEVEIRQKRCKDKNPVRTPVVEQSGF